VLGRNDHGEEKVRTNSERSSAYEDIDKFGMGRMESGTPMRYSGWSSLIGLGELNKNSGRAGGKRGYDMSTVWNLVSIFYPRRLKKEKKRTGTYLIGGFNSSVQLNHSQSGNDVLNP